MLLTLTVLKSKTPFTGVFLHLYQMKEIVLELLFRLTVGAASGLHCVGSDVYIIADNSGYVYHYNLDRTSFEKYQLYDAPQDITPKKEKKDLEAMAAQDGQLYVFGSGSKKKRQMGYVFNTKSQKSLALNLEPLYSRLKSKGQISKDDLNIEGAIFYGKDLLLFQRGNGAAARNGVFVVKGKDKFSDSADVSFTEVKLPQIEGVTATFTDAVAVKDKIYFLAAAEGTDSTYDDGVIYGTLVGILDPKTFKVLSTEVVGKGKYEGITLLKQHKNKVEFLICEDNDKNQSEGGVYKLVIGK